MQLGWFTQLQKRQVQLFIAQAMLLLKAMLFVTIQLMGLFNTKGCITILNGSIILSKWDEISSQTIKKLVKH